MRRLVLIVFLCWMCGFCCAQSFRFVQISDTHIRPDASTIDDLRKSVMQINELDSIAFVIVSGDITHKGDSVSMAIAKQELDKLSIPYFVIPGNHDTKWSDRCGTDFKKVFGNDRFELIYDSCYFAGLSTGPVVPTSVGHVSDNDIAWLDSCLRSHANMKCRFVVTHYPLQSGDIDNYESVLDVVVRNKVDCIFSGHYHRNIFFDCGGVADIITRTNQRDSTYGSGFSIMSISRNSVVCDEINESDRFVWLELPLSNNEKSE